MKNLDTLTEEYPEFFRLEERKKQEGPKMPFVLFGFECGDGWYVILKRLFSWIKWNVEQNDYPMIVVDQVKEKFGGLRFYYEFLPFKDHVWSKYHEKWNNEEKQRWFDNHCRVISGATEYAESLSYHICERCGSTDDVTTAGDGWIVTRCAQCRKEVKDAEEN